LPLHVAGVEKHAFLAFSRFQSPRHRGGFLLPVGNLALVFPLDGFGFGKRGGGGGGGVRVVFVVFVRFVRFVRFGFGPFFFGRVRNVARLFPRLGRRLVLAAIRIGVT
jgi:hypothetical protein|tara:strand:+ start:500 stop:823 length:324 start_codon:yes stop_codon:yes gene_type:complete